MSSSDYFDIEEFDRARLREEHAVPTVTRLPEGHGPWARYRITGDDPARYVTVLVAIRNGRHCIDHTIDCLTSLHHWPEYFEAWRGYRDIPNGFDLTDAGRELFKAADRLAAEGRVA